MIESEYALDYVDLMRTHFFAISESNDRINRLERMEEYYVNRLTLAEELLILHAKTAFRIDKATTYSQKST
jgi:hypothetical protein